MTADSARNHQGTHSPGPWRRMPYVNNPAITSLTVLDADGRDVATCHMWRGEPDYHDTDADLIATAPELLAALVKCVECRACWGQSSDPHTCDIGGARAAIRKARGT